MQFQYDKKTPQTVKCGNHIFLRYFVLDPVIGNPYTIACKQALIGHAAQTAKQQETNQQSTVWLVSLGHATSPKRACSQANYTTIAGTPACFDNFMFE